MKTRPNLLIDLTFLGILLAKDDKEAQKNSKYD
jgi:hypothetical protein